MATFTPQSEIESALKVLRGTFRTGRTKDLAWRKWQLKQCWWMVEDNEKAILEALNKDLGRHPFESTMTDIAAVKNDVLDHINSLEKWTADEFPDAGFFFGKVGKARMRREPLGVVLILGTWNFPIATALQPFCAAIAAGNCIVLKPSEVAQASMRLLEELVPRYLDSSAIRCVTGGPQETSFILEQRFDHIFFTGSDKIARIVAQAAAKNLTSTTLECGGQNPTIVTKTANLDLAAKRIAHSKLMNAGQICLSANHIFADPAIHDELLERLKSWNDKLYKGNESQMPHIVSEKHINRLQNLLDTTEGHVEYRSPIDKHSKSFGPTIVTNVTMEDSLLSDEIFGPILAIIKATPREAYDFIEDTPGPPLGAYIFSQDRKEIDEALLSTRSGGVTVNSIMLHAAVPNAPFGGVGLSGQGSYHGPWGLRAFSHTRTVVEWPAWMEYLMTWTYHPFDEKNIAKVAVKKRGNFKRGEGIEDQRIGRSRWLAPWFVTLLGAGIAVIAVAK